MGCQAARSVFRAKLLFTTPSMFSGCIAACVLEAAKKYRRFPLFSSWAGVLLTASASLGNIVFTTLYGAAVGGFLFLGDRVLMQPLRVSGNALLQVFVGEAGRVLSRQSLGIPATLHRGAVEAGCGLGGVAGRRVSVLDSGSSVHFRTFVGTGSAVHRRHVDRRIFPTAVAIPVNHTLLLMGRQRLSAALDTLRFAALLASIAIARHFGASSIEAVLLYSVTQGAAQSLILGVMYARVRRLAVPIHQAV